MLQGHGNLPRVTSYLKASTRSSQDSFARPAQSEVSPQAVGRGEADHGVAPWPEIGCGDQVHRLVDARSPIRKPLMCQRWAAAWPIGGQFRIQRGEDVAEQ